MMASYLQVSSWLPCLCFSLPGVLGDSKAAPAQARAPPVLPMQPHSKQERPLVSTLPNATLSCPNPKQLFEAAQRLARQPDAALVALLEFHTATGEQLGVAESRQLD